MTGSENKTEFETELVKLTLGKGKSTITVHLEIGLGDDGLPNHLSAGILDSGQKFGSRIRQLMAAYTMARKHGATLEEICGELKYHKDGALRCTSSPYVPMASSIPDMIGRYLENRYLKMPLIRRILSHGINPFIATGKDGVLYLNWKLEDLEALSDGCVIEYF